MFGHSRIDVMKLLILPEELVAIRPLPVAFKRLWLYGQNITPSTCLGEQSTLQQILDADGGVV